MVGRFNVVGTPDRVGHNKLEAGEVVDGCNCSFCCVEYVVEASDFDLCNFLIPRNLLDGNSGSFVENSVV